MSGGGDGTLCLWDFVPGTLLCKVEIPEFVKDESAVVSLSAFKDSIAVALEGYTDDVNNTVGNLESVSGRSSLKKSLSSRNL